MSPVALVVLYRYPLENNIPTDNIPAVEEIYHRRFSNIHHLVPFYQGNQSNVTPVYAHPDRLHGSLASSAWRFFHRSYHHYLFVREDTILNPRIDENNYAEYFELDKDTSFLPHTVALSKQTLWRRQCIATYIHRFKQFLGIRLKPELGPPTARLEALLQLSSTDAIESRMFRFEKLLGLNSADAVMQWERSFTTGDTPLFVVDQGTIQEFSWICGVFALTLTAKSAFAVPTSLVFTAQKLITEKDLQLKSKCITKSQHRYYTQFESWEQHRFPESTLCFYLKH